MESLPFEEAFERLETAIAALQDGKISLNEALQHYQDGTNLVQYCNELLQRAELTVQQLSVDTTGTLSIVPLDA